MDGALRGIAAALSLFCSRVIRGIMHKSPVTTILQKNENVSKNKWSKHTHSFIHLHTHSLVHSLHHSVSLIVLSSSLTWKLHKEPLVRPLVLHATNRCWDWQIVWSSHLQMHQVHAKPQARKTGEQKCMAMHNYFKCMVRPQTSEFVFSFSERVLLAASTAHSFHGVKWERGKNHICFLWFAFDE